MEEKIVYLLFDSLPHFNAPAGFGPPRSGGETGDECIEPPNQHRTVRLAQVAPAFWGDVSPTTQLTAKQSNSMPARTSPRSTSCAFQVDFQAGLKNVALGVTLELTCGHNLW